MNKGEWMLLLEQAVLSASQRYVKHFASSPRWIVAAPGRVNLIGEHTDYNDGFVLPMAIDRYCVIAAGDTPGNSAVVRSDLYGEVVIPLENPLRQSGTDEWSNYLAGVIALSGQRNMQLSPFQAVIQSEIPLGGGLSSSAALEVATATLLETITGTVLPSVEKALLCQQAEHEYAGVPCGIMDQFASTMCQANHLMLLDCRSQAIEQIPLTDHRVSVMIINSQVKHELVAGIYAERRNQCETAAKALGVSSLREATQGQLEAKREQLKPAEYLRARHVLGEIERTIEAADAIKKNAWSQVGQLMYASHDSLRNDYEVSCRELDLLVELAQNLGDQGGVIGSRMTGGGFGGCTVSLVWSDAAEEVAARIREGYLEQTGIEPTVFTTRPARGAHVVHTD